MLRSPVSPTISGNLGQSRAISRLSSIPSAASKQLSPSHRSAPRSNTSEGARAAVAAAKCLSSLCWQGPPSPAAASAAAAAAVHSSTVISSTPTKRNRGAARTSCLRRTRRGLARTSHISPYLPISPHISPWPRAPPPLEARLRRERRSCAAAPPAGHVSDMSWACPGHGSSRTAATPPCGWESRTSLFTAERCEETPFTESAVAGRRAESAWRPRSSEGRRRQRARHPPSPAPTRACARAEFIWGVNTVSRRALRAPRGHEGCRYSGVQRSTANTVHTAERSGVRVFSSAGWKTRARVSLLGFLTAAADADPSPSSLPTNAPSRGGTTAAPPAPAV